MLDDNEDDVLDIVFSDLIRPDKGEPEVTEDQPAVITKKFYPMDHAVRLAAVQNARADYGPKLKFDKLSEKEQNCYLSSARALLEATSMNQLPVFPETEHICLKKG